MGNDIQKETKLQGKEKLSYWIYFFGQNIFYGLVAINMQTFFSDVGITATAIAVIMFFTKLWDAVNDPLLGIIVDKVHFKSGRFLPWLRISLPLLAISSVFLFFLPGQASPVVKIAWATIAYKAPEYYHFKGRHGESNGFRHWEDIRWRYNYFQCDGVSTLYFARTGKRGLQR